MTSFKTKLYGFGIGISMLTSAPALAQDTHDHDAPGHQHTRNCHTMHNLERLIKKDPDAEKRMRNIEKFTQNYVQQKGKNRRIEATVYTIPVVVHVLYNNSTENISEAQIQSQIDVLNADFRKLNSDAGLVPSEFAPVAADTEIQFILATTDPNGNPTTGITRTSTSVSSFSTNDAMKFSAQGGKNAWDTQKYLNMWVCDLGGGILGYAQFPGSGSAATDGVVMGYKYFGTTGAATAPFDGGRTTTHEVGHWLNLRHIWGDGNCSQDDFVNDTPTAGAPNYNCPSFPSKSCTNNGGFTSDMFMNYMDYVDDNCMHMFTAGQKERMRAVLAPGGFREALVGGGSTTPPDPIYCVSKGNDSSYEWIAGVVVGSLNSTSGNDGGYSDKTSTSVDLAKGSAYAVALTPGYASQTYNEYWKIWIDFNGDNDFEDAGELVFDAGSLSSTTVNGNITIPASATTGTTRMRVSMKYNAAQTSCEAFSYGEVEDYTVNITGSGSTPSCNTPTGLISSAITASSFTLSWGAVSGASGYEARVRVAGGTWSTFNSTATSLNLTGASASTMYECQVRTTCSGTSSAYSSSLSVTTSAVVAPTYCASQGNSTSDEWIQRVQVGSIDNNSGNNGGYADFTNLQTALSKGSTYNITITPAWAARSYREAYAVWIDYNQDGDFADAGETVYTRSRTTSSSVTGSFTVSSVALNGATRMRVAMKYNANPTSCETFSYGEVEDYTINIINASAKAVHTAPTAHHITTQHSANARGKGLKDMDFPFVAYPNPVMQELNIRLGYFDVDSEIKIYNLMGKQLMNKMMVAPQTSLDVSGLPKGMYILSIRNGRETETLKFIKQ